MDEKRHRDTSAAASADTQGGPKEASSTRARSARRKRLPPHEREQMILDEATRFFAEHGFRANIRDLANHAGVSQGLIFRYFGSKEKLVQRVYERTFLQRWRPDWERTLQNKDETLEKRLGDFYKSYLQTVDDYIWVRIALLSGLSGNNLTSKYIQENVAGLMRIIATELRRESGETTDAPFDLLEMEQVWMLHSTFIYYLIRKHIFKTPTTKKQGEFVDLIVRNFLAGRLAKH